MDKQTLLVMLFIVIQPAHHRYYCNHSQKNHPKFKEYVLTMAGKEYMYVLLLVWHGVLQMIWHLASIVI